MSDTTANNNDIRIALEKVMRIGSNQELALIADNPDGTAEILVLRGDAGMPDTYWYHVDGNVMLPSFKKLVLSALKEDESFLNTDDGLYTYMATACGVAACFQVDVPGVHLREATFGPFDVLLYRFILEMQGFNYRKTIYIKRNSNIAYRYRKLVEAQNRAAAKDTDDGDEFFDVAGEFFANDR